MLIANGIKGGPLKDAINWPQNPDLRCYRQSGWT
jgi:hypothetical protein